MLHSEVIEKCFKLFFVEVNGYMVKLYSQLFILTTKRIILCSKNKLI